MGKLDYEPSESAFIAACQSESDFTRFCGEPIGSYKSNQMMSRFLRTFYPVGEVVGGDPIFIF
jgi:hypothetical protein